MNKENVSQTCYSCEECITDDGDVYFDEGGDVYCAKCADKWRQKIALEIKMPF